MFKADPYDIQFKDTPDGRAFYPFCHWSKGRLVTPEVEEETKRRLRRFNIVFATGLFFILSYLLLGSLALLLSNWMLLPPVSEAAGYGAVGLFLLLVYGSHQAYVLSPSSSAPRTEVRMTAADMYAAQARCMPLGSVLFCAAAGVMLIAYTPYLFLTSPELLRDWWSGLPFVLGFIIFYQMFRVVWARFHRV